MRNFALPPFAQSWCSSARAVCLLAASILSFYKGVPMRRLQLVLLSLTLAASTFAQGRGGGGFHGGGVGFRGGIGGSGGEAPPRPYTPAPGVIYRSP